MKPQTATTTRVVTRTVTVSTIRPDAPTTLSGLKAAFKAEVEALIAQYPGQEQNRADYMSMLANARLGIMRRKFASKGNFTVLPKGATVLVIETRDTDVTVFAPSVKDILVQSVMPSSWVKM